MKSLIQEEINQLKITADGRLTRKAAARYLSMSPRTLADRHRKGLAPRSVKVGSRRFYFLTDLDAYIGCSNKSEMQ